MEANKVNFAYVAGLYSTIKDSQVKVTDAEIVDFMKKNEKKYKADQSREIEYVLLEDKASAQDEADVKAKITALLSGSVVYNAKTAKNDTVAGFRNAANAAPRATASSGADGITMNGSLPDASISAGLKLSAADFATAWAAGTLPVNAMPCVPSCATKYWPTSAPPVTTCTRPTGR